MEVELIDSGIEDTSTWLNWGQIFFSLLVS